MNEKAIPTINEIRAKAVPVLHRYGAKRAGLFGSAARGQLRSRSDVDILVDLGRAIGLYSFIGLKMELEDALDRKVDLVEYDAIKPLIRERILREEVRIL